MRKMRVENKLYDIGKEQETGLIEFCEYLDMIGNTKKQTLVEIGTFTGESAVIFSNFFKKVITIDPWDEIFIKSIASDKEVTIKDLYNELEKNIKGHENITFVRQPSLIAAQSFLDKSIDVVYIDGWHRVIPACLDIMTWLPKIKLGGVISGHDFTTMHMSEVIPAVRYTLSSPDEVFPDSSWLKFIGGKK